MQQFNQSTPSEVNEIGQKEDCKHRNRRIRCCGRVVDEQASNDNTQCQGKGNGNGNGKGKGKGNGAQMGKGKKRGHENCQRRGNSQQA